MSTIWEWLLAIPTVSIPYPRTYAIARLCGKYAIAYLKPCVIAYLPMR